MSHIATHCRHVTNYIASCIANAIMLASLPRLVQHIQMQCFSLNCAISDIWMHNKASVRFSSHTIHQTFDEVEGRCPCSSTCCFGAFAIPTPQAFTFATRTSGKTVPKIHKWHGCVVVYLKKKYVSLCKTIYLFHFFVFPSFVCE